MYRHRIKNETVFKRHVYIQEDSWFNSASVKFHFVIIQLKNILLGKEHQLFNISFGLLDSQVSKKNVTKDF